MVEAPNKETEPPPDQTDRLSQLLVVIGSVALIAGLAAIAAAGWAFLNDGDAAAGPAVSEPTVNTPTSTLPGIALQYTPIADGLIEPSGGVGLPRTDRLLVLERHGRIRMVAGGRLLEEPVLDLTDRVSAYSLEAGLLGVALHPEFEANGRIFLTYTNRDDVLQLSEFSMDDLVIDPESERKILEAPPTLRGAHIGGSVAFGPDGYLWLGIGDGGGDGDSHRHGQNPLTVQGTVLRIDVESETAYAIPPSNPFVDGQEGAPEVWAYGFRNPWRLAFDDKHLYAADVGEITYEEINVIPLDEPGHNFGWSLWEGPECFRVDECTDDVDAITPAVALDRSLSCAVIGGPVYQGTSIPELRGNYFYADYCTARLWSLKILPDGSVETTQWPDLDASVSSYVTSFAEDGMGEMYILTWHGGLLKIEATRSG